MRNAKGNAKGNAECGMRSAELSWKLPAESALTCASEAAELEVGSSWKLEVGSWELIYLVALNVCAESAVAS